MPELPEVETVVRTLEKQIKNKKIEAIDIYYPNIIEGDIDSFKKSLIGQHFNKFLRRGKFLLFELDDYTLVAHLRMEGKFFIYKEKTEKSKHTHIIFKLSDNTYLHYNDVRKFGRMSIIPKQDNYDDFHNLGLEPLDKRLNASYLFKAFTNKKKEIKLVLLQQDIVAGLGNIYADEVLFKAQINPLRKACSLNIQELERLVIAVKETIKEAIKQGGTTIRSYTSSLGVTGRFQQSLNVYGKKGEACPVCGKEITKIFLGGRGTHFCENCQKRKYRYAITGSIGSGKTSFCNYLKEEGIEVIDCDKINSDLLKTEKVIKLIKENFPTAVINNEIDKVKLASIVFNNQKEKEKLEKIMHPLILEEIFKKEDDPLYVEVPLLFESGFERYFDKSLLITCQKEVAIKRLKKRGLSEEEANKRYNSQMSVKEKLKLADEVLYNDGSLAQLKKKAKTWLKENEAQ